MRLIVDTSIFVEVDRGNKEVIKVLKKYTIEEDVFISVITISEILTGAHLRKNYEIAVEKAKKIMGQMIWINIDPIIAEKAGEINAYLILNGKKIEFQDVLIAATSIVLKCDYIITLNKNHFERIPLLKKMILTPQELKEKFNTNSEPN